MGWSATYETYLTFLSKFPLLDKDWELQLLPITAVRPGGSPSLLIPPATTTAVALSKSTSFMESLVPFGGLVHDTYEANSLTPNSCPRALRCQQCNDRYEQEVAIIIRASGVTAEDHHLGGLPSLVQNGSMIGPSNGFDAVKVRDQMVLNSKISSLQKKWNEYCLRLHQGCHRINSGPYQLFPNYTGVPADGERAANLSRSSESVALQREVVRPSVVSASHTNTTTKSISPPSISNQRNENLVLELQAGHSKSDEQDKRVQSRHETLSNFHDHEDHVSPSSVASVATDLVLGTPRESSSKGTNSACWKHEMAKKCYVVYIGRVPDVYEEWKDCQKQVNNFSGNSYQAYKSREVAEEKWRRHGRKKWRNFLVITTLLLFMVGYVLYFI